MLRNHKQPNQKGFTIIEVLIVLAIAGLIMLIIFLAVPALQRSSRNTQRRNDVASLLGAVSEYSNNNNGALPSTSGTFSAKFTNVNPNLGYYTTAANITWTHNTTASAPADPADLDKVVIADFSKCDTTTNTATTTGATQRSVVALYDVEGSGGTKVPQCRES